MADLTNRELATLILVAALASACVLIPSWRRRLGPNFVSVLRALFAWKIVVLTLLFAGYTIAVVLLLRSVHLWSSSLLKDTILIWMFAGFPALMRAYKIADGRQFVAQMLRTTVGVSALVSFYVNVESLPLWAELLLQPVLALVAMLAAYAETQREHAPVGLLMNSILAIAGLVLVAYVTGVILTEWSLSDARDGLWALGLAVWLPLAFIPFAYASGYCMRVGQILSSLPRFVDSRSIPPTRRLALASGLRGSARLAAQFTGLWRPQFAQAESLGASREVLREFRASMEPVT